LYYFSPQLMYRFIPMRALSGEFHEISKWL
jgi:hypothetical protein